MAGYTFEQLQQMQSNASEGTVDEPTSRGFTFEELQAQARQLRVTLPRVLVMQLC
jgi:hypothetical protein